MSIFEWVFVVIIMSILVWIYVLFVVELTRLVFGGMS